MPPLSGAVSSESFSPVYAIYGNFDHIGIVTCVADVSWNGKNDSVRESRTLAPDPLFSKDLELCRVTPHAAEFKELRDQNDNRENSDVCSW